MTNAYKTITSVPGWVEMVNGQEKISGAASAFNLVPLVYRCTNLICDALSSVPVVYTKGGKETEKPSFFEWNEQEWLWKTCAAHLLRGASFSVILKNSASSKISKGLQWINPYEMNINVIDNSITFDRSGQKWNKEEILYTHEFNPGNDVLPGKSPVEVAMRDASMIRYITSFGSAFFENGAMPVTILPVPSTTTDAEKQRVQGLFRQIMTGIKSAFRVIAINQGKDSDMKPYQITPDINTLSMPELEDRSRRAVLSAFGVPPTMVEDAANYATAKEHRLSFWQDTVKPRGIRLEGRLNDQVFKPMGYEFHLDFSSLDIFQEDEAERASSLSQLTGAGLDILTACEILGYDLTDEQIARMSKPKEEPKPIIINQQPEQQPQPMVEQPEPDPQATRSALFNWKAAALKAIKTGNKANIEFDNPSIPDYIADAIRDGLENSTTADQVHEVFKEAREWLKRPINEQIISDQIKRANNLLEKLYRSSEDSKPIVHSVDINVKAV